MACPFFVPVEPLGRDHWLHAPRFPLGEAYRGVCRAQSEPFTPSDSSVEDVCNCGYARGRCERFPPDAADAVRFSVRSEDERRVRIIYVVERDHTPESHGMIEYSKGTGEIRFAGSRLEAQARAFVASYLRNTLQKTASGLPAASTQPAIEERR